MQFAAVVILYNPPDNVLENIGSYQQQAGRLYVVNNGPALPGDLTRVLRTVPHVQLIDTGGNQGIARRLNQVAALAKDEGFQWLLTMDQDSRFPDGALQAYLDCLTHQTAQDVAMAGVQHQEEKVDQRTCRPVDVNQLITSGSFVNLDIFNRVGGFQEALFIDQVDIEYCFRAKLKGFRIVRFDNIFLEHSLGMAHEQRSLKNFKRTSRSLHAPGRLYYMVRNYFWVNRAYGQYFKNDLGQMRKDVLTRIKNNLLYGKGKGKHLLSIVAAWKDFKTNKMGERVRL